MLFSQDHKDDKWDWEYDKKNLNSAIERLQKAQNAYEKTLKEKNKMIAEIEAIGDGKISKNEEEIKEMEEMISKKREEIEPQILQFNSINQAMKEQFDGLIDNRDWCNVDLIIFNYETGRALDMRDALLQVDDERRNNRLIKAVRSASIQVSSSIKQGFAGLQATIDRQFEELNGTISRFSSQILTESGKNIYHLNNNLEKIAEISTAQSALLNKMNISSDQMANDIENMRQLANYTYYKT